MSTQLPTNLLAGLFGGSVVPPSVAAQRTAKSEDAKEGEAAKTGSSTKDALATGKPTKAGDTVTLSPEAKALTPTKATPDPFEKAARERFEDAAKRFFIELTGVDPQKVDEFTLNDAARRYLARNTVIGALAPPGLREELGLDVTGRYKADKDPAKRELATFTVKGRDDQTLAKVAFDAEALEEYARLPRWAKDKNGDRYFSISDLVPLSKKLAGSEGFGVDPGKRFAKEDTRVGERVKLSDDNGNAFFFAGFPEGDDKARYRAVNLAFGLLQFAGFAPPPV